MSYFLFQYTDVDTLAGVKYTTDEVSTVMAGSPFHLQGGSHPVPQKTGTHAAWVTFASRIAESTDRSASSLKVRDGKEGKEK